MGITGTEIAAYVGAAAWLPPIAYWIHGWLVKPVVQIVPERQIELGFTTFGPIFNVRVALSARRKDAVIDRMWIELRHEGGELRRLTWTGMRETFSEITDAAGNRQLVEKDQPAIALKVGTALLTEKFVRFQDLRFHKGLRPLRNALLDHLIYLKGQEADLPEAVMASRELHDVVEFYKSSFWWKPGRYTVQFGIESRERAGLQAQTLGAELTQHDVDALQHNLDLIAPGFENELRFPSTDLQLRILPWTWRYIPLVDS